MTTTNFPLTGYNFNVHENFTPPKYLLYAYGITSISKYLPITLKGFYEER